MDVTDFALWLQYCSAPHLGQECSEKGMISRFVEPSAGRTQYSLLNFEKIIAPEEELIMVSGLENLIFRRAANPGK